MRTLWVTNDFPPRAGGIEQFVANLTARLDPASVHVLASAWPGAAAHDARLPYRVERITRRPMLPTPAVLRAVRAVVRAHGAEAVVFGASWPLGELAAHLTVPTFALTHGHEAGMARIGGGPLLSRVGRGVDAVSFISRFTHDALAPWLAPFTRLHHLPPGVDTRLFHPDVDGAAVRAQHGIDPAEPLVVCISRLVRRKGQDVLVEAWPDVRAAVPGARLLLVGSGPLRARLRRRVTALGLDAAVTFVTSVPHDELPAYHAAADVFAMPCRTRAGGLDVEGLGIVYLEAQATGRPVVAGRSGGAPEALIDGQTGVVVDGTDRRAVAGALVRLLTDPEERRVLGERGRRFMTQHYEWDVIAARLREILEGLPSARQGH